MKTKAIPHLALAIAAIITFAEVSSSANASPTPAEQAQIDQMKTSYPMDTCPVSGDKLSGSSMGDKPVDQLYTQTNPDGTKTTRLVRFCCKDCVVKFKRNPDKYLKILDAAQAKKDASNSSSSSMSGMNK